MRYVSSGPVDAPVVVLLHGFMGTLADWDEVIADLSRDYRCVAVDLPGHGRTPWELSEAGDTFGELNATLLNLLDSLGLPSASFLGYSMGGRLALQFAYAYPDRVRSLVLESASPGLRTEVEKETRSAHDDAWGRMLETLDYWDFLRAWYDQPVFQSLTCRTPLLDELIKRRLSNDPAQLVQALRGFSTGRYPSMWEGLSSLDMPVLLIAGKEDGKYVELAQEMTDLLPHGEQHVVENAGHIVHLESPVEFISITRDFLARHALG